MGKEEKSYRIYRIHLLHGEAIETLKEMIDIHEKEAMGVRIRRKQKGRHKMRSQKSKEVLYDFAFLIERIAVFLYSVIQEAVCKWKIRLIRSREGLR